jgi:hypothetical protein
MTERSATGNWETPLGPAARPVLSVPGPVNDAHSTPAQLLQDFGQVGVLEFPA